MRELAMGSIWQTLKLTSADTPKALKDDARKMLDNGCKWEATAERKPPVPVDLCEQAVPDLSVATQAEEVAMGKAWNILKLQDADPTAKALAQQMVDTCKWEDP